MYHQLTVACTCCNLLHIMHKAVADDWIFCLLYSAVLVLQFQTPSLRTVDSLQCSYHELISFLVK